MPPKTITFSNIARAASLLAALISTGCASRSERIYPGDHASIKDTPHVPSGTGQPVYIKAKTVIARPRAEPVIVRPDQDRVVQKAKATASDRRKVADARPEIEASRAESAPSGQSDEVRPSLSSRRSVPDGVDGSKSPAQPKSADTIRPAQEIPAARQPIVSEVSQVIEQAELMLRIGNVKGAREVLAPAVKAQNPEALAELGKTYDPIELAKFLTALGAADSAKAIALYTEAARLGSLVAKVRLERLTAPTIPVENRR